MKHSLLIAALTAAALSGCATQGQNAAGITEFELIKDPKTGELDSVRLVDGKEKASVRVHVELPNGLLATYSASDVKAFDAHKARAEVEQALIGAGVEVTPSLVDLILGVLAP